MKTDNPNTKERTATRQPANQSRDDHTRFQLDILAVIAGYETGRYRNQKHSGSEPHGLAIKQTLDARYGETVNHGRLYPNLDDLIDDGLVEKFQADRRTNQYALTDAGWEFLRRRAQWTLGCLEGESGGDQA